MKFSLLSNLLWLSKRLYNLFFTKNLIQSLGSWAQNVVVVLGVQVKSCSVMEMQLMVSLCTSMFCLFQTSFFFKQFIFKKSSILSVSCVLSSCGKSCSTCKIFTSSGCKDRLQDNSKKQRKILQSS